MWPCEGFLLDSGALLDYRTFSGGNVLINAVDNEDSDPEVIRLILETSKSSCCSSPEQEFHSIVNYKRTSTTLKWKGIYFVAKTLYRSGISKTGLMEYLAMESGMTSLHCAARRGDVEIVEMLLENGADSYVENDLDMNAFQVCEKFGPFPQVMSVLHNTHV